MTTERESRPVETTTAMDWSTQVLQSPVRVSLPMNRFADCPYNCNNFLEFGGRQCFSWNDDDHRCTFQRLRFGLMISIFPIRPAAVDWNTSLCTAATASSSQTAVHCCRLGLEGDSVSAVLPTKDDDDDKETATGFVVLKANQGSMC